MLPKKTMKKHFEKKEVVWETIEPFWFHLAEIDAFWETGQLTTKTCNWDSLF